MKKATINFLLLFAVLFFSYSYSQNSTLINHNSPFENSLQNKNTASNPTVTITGSRINYTPSPFTAIFTFSENIQNFSLSDVVVSNATTGVFNKINESKYTALITPISDGIVTVDVPANSLQDLANNDNLASNTFSIIYDTTKPTVVITSDTPNPTNAASFVATFTFSEDVADFDETYFSLTNANYSNFVYINDALFKVTITPIADGTVSITIPENEIEDNAGNGIVAAQFSINVDRTKPTTTITCTVSNQTNAAFTTTITFSEDITGFDINDITLGNATASNFVATSATLYSALITPTADGIVTVDVSNDVANDAATNGNIAATQFSITYDATKPTTPSILSVDSYTCARDNTTTADNTLVFNGESEPNSQIEVFVNTISVGVTTAIANGTWSFDYTSVTLPDATYSITAKATDTANNVSDLSSIFTIKVSTVDTDGDLIPDFCDDDDDNDGVLDDADNSYLPNPGQEDTDGDGIADVEEDCDNDGIINYYDTDVATCQNAIVMKQKYGFSPNGDGINETWVIEDILLYPNNIVHIYNRSGKLVYQMKGYNNSFNGFSNKVNSSKRLPVGAYYFTIEFNTPNSKPAKGWIYINY
ncbi:hypothetical protein KCTC32516_00381 [Polaribacter huanghezhanensis]|uniref:Ig-like domain-containing protein n=1 Tax=Polaribacter huanghezhanensis TaxID=1354726 RepID=UPI00264928F3|nr:Ig-like domain-containing protein [Polaribacter huanghezhanensis]WKD85043.1 hypothetical protein KCTC32516_00381 [Polaribacter huanghezhanensis]